MQNDNIPRAYGRYRKQSNHTTAIVILSICLALAILAIGLLWFASVNWSITIDNSDTQQVLRYREELKYPKAYLSSQYLDIKPIKLHMNPTNSINTNQIGIHRVEFVAQRLGHRVTLIQNVVVVDTKSPVIELIHKEGYYTLMGEEYVEEGYNAFDEYDGDLTDKVVVKRYDNYLIYSVKDSSGNTTSVRRDINWRDSIKPEIILNGEESITLVCGDLFVDLGATANDNCDGDITYKIVAIGDVDTQKPGTYTITYEVSDVIGNKACATRNIIVIEKKPEHEEINPSHKNGKTIYLTFDDGPGPHTAQLLDVLKKYNIQATFFVVGKKCTPEILNRMVAEGHSIGLHSTNHQYSKVYSSEEAFLDDLFDAQQIVKEMTGLETYLLRFPGGSSNTISANYKKGIMKSLVKTVQDLGFQYFDWNVDSGDASFSKDTETVIDSIKKGVAPYTNSIVLQHDIKDFSVAAVEEIVLWGLENGYIFAKLDVNSPAAHHNVNN